VCRLAAIFFSALRCPFAKLMVSRSTLIVPMGTRIFYVTTSHQISSFFTDFHHSGVKT
jgi:hypothetical protein